jgi:hypothetical protein
MGKLCIMSTPGTAVAPRADQPQANPDIAFQRHGGLPRRSRQAQGFWISSSSTSNSKVELAGITPPIARSP